MAGPSAALANTCSYRIAYCLPVLRSSDTDDSSFLQQMLIMNGLRARGHALTLVAPYDLFEVVCITDIGEPRFVNRTWTKKTWFNFTGRLFWWIQKRMRVPYLNVFSNLRWFDAYVQCLPGHDIVQERNGLYKMGVAMACKHFNLPYVYFFDADDLLEHDLFGRPLAGILRWRAKQVLRFNLKTADRIVCLSASAEAHLKATWRVPGEKIVVIPNGVDVKRFRPYPEARVEVRKNLGMDDCPLIIFVGTFFPYQDVAVLLRAFAAVLREYPKAHLLLVGKGEQFPKMLQYAADLGITDSTQFIGFKPHSEIPRLLGAADIAVAPYCKIENERFLGSSMKLFEYMASGLPVIASNIGQINEVIQNGVNGLLVPTEDTQALATALKTLIDDPELRSRLGQQARKDSTAKYSWEQYISHFERLYESLLAQGSFSEVKS